MSSKKKGHFLSKFYLAGFTRSGQRTDLLTVIDKHIPNRFKRPAEEVAHERYLFRLEGENPEWLEDEFAAVEDQIAPVLRGVAESLEWPPPDREVELLVHLVGLNMSRPPAAIDEVTLIGEEETRGQLIQSFSPDSLAELIRGMEGAGEDVSEYRDSEELRRRLVDGRLRVRFSRNHALFEAVRYGANVVDHLLARGWSLCRAEDGADFICSDFPVTVAPRMPVPAGYEPNIVDGKCDVVMPLTRKLCLVGHPEPYFEAKDLDGMSVAFINALTLLSSVRFLYSPRDDFQLFTRERKVVDGKEFYDDLVRAGHKRDNATRNE